MDRSAKIVRVSVIGIAANIVLAAFKAAVGLIAGSIAIVLDAVNNLSDAFSSVVTIVGTKLANKPADRKHPYGHGRVEYITSVIIAVIVLLAGVTSFREAIAAVLHPEAASYSLPMLVIVAAAVAVKFLLGRYVKAKGAELHSESLIASGTDAFFDAAVSSTTLVGALVSLLFHRSIEGWLGILISVFIVKAGVEILMDALSSIIGTRAEEELSSAVRARINAADGVLGTYDLILHHYGPEKIIGSAHIEVPDELTAREIHLLTRKITEDVFHEFGILLTIGIYAANSDDPAVSEIRRDIESAALKYPEILGTHGFYVDEEAKRVSVDLLMDFGADTKEICRAFCEEISAMHPDYRFDVILDSDFSD